MSLTGKARVAGVMGWPVGHSRSPALHGHWLARYRIDGTYVPMPVEPAGLAQALKALPVLGFRGANLTIPHKEAALAHVDRVEEGARRIGAINTVVRATDGSLTGHNTDVSGLRAALAEAGVAALDGRPCAVIGAGGAARAALCVAARLGAGEVRVWNRTADKAEAVTRALGVGRVVAELAEALEGAALVLQASASGMDLGAAETQELAAELTPGLQRTSPEAHVCDLVYRPRRTAWVLAAEAAGRRGQDGLAMLVHQAAEAFRLWTGARPDAVAMRMAAEARTR